MNGIRRYRILMVVCALSLATPAAAANRLFNFDIARQQDAVTVTWESRFPGIDDTLRYRTPGSTQWQTAVNPELESTSQEIVDAALLLVSVGVPIRDGQTEAFEQVLADGGITLPYDEGFVETLVAFDRRLRARRCRDRSVSHADSGRSAPGVWR